MMAANRARFVIATVILQQKLRFYSPDGGNFKSINMTGNFVAPEITKEKKKSKAHEDYKIQPTAESIQKDLFHIGVSVGEREDYSSDL